MSTFRPSNYELESTAFLWQTGRAVQGSRMGQRFALIVPGRHVGGKTSAGWATLNRLLDEAPVVVVVRLRRAARLLENPRTPWPYPAIIHCRRAHAAVQTETYRYIRYEDGSEELYDHTKDPNEWTNLAHLPELSRTREHKHLQRAGTKSDSG